MGFTVKGEKCISCRAVIPHKKGTPKPGPLCKHCAPRESEVMMAKQHELGMLEQKHARLWTQCQRCQGDLHSDVLCSNKDCPIFFMRVKVQKDLDQVQTTLNKFTVEDVAW
jgi:DNA polymerase delta subunit 1